MNASKINVPLYIQIANSIVERIQSGELSVGDRLRSERSLSEDLAVSRMTIRQALQTLEEQGLIERQQGRGSFISKPKVGSASITRAKPLSCGTAGTAAR